MSALLQIDGTVNDTGWIDISWIVDDIGFSITGAWAGGGNTIALDLSYQPFQKGVARTQWSTPATYTVNVGPLGLPRAAATAIRFRRVGAWVGGAPALIGISTGKNSDGKVLDIAIETTVAGSGA